MGRNINFIHEQLNSQHSEACKSEWGLVSFWSHCIYSDFCYHNYLICLMFATMLKHLKSYIMFPQMLKWSQGWQTHQTGCFQTLESWVLCKYQCSYPQSHGANGLVAPLIRSFPDMEFKFHLCRCQSVLWKLPYSPAGLWHFFGEKINFLFSIHVPVFWQISTTHNGSI